MYIRVVEAWYVSGGPWTKLRMLPFTASTSLTSDAARGLGWAGQRLALVIVYIAREAKPSVVRIAPPLSVTETIAFLRQNEHRHLHYIARLTACRKLCYRQREGVLNRCVTARMASDRGIVIAALGQQRYHRNTRDSLMKSRRHPEWCMFEISPLTEQRPDKAPYPSGSKLL